MGHDAGVPKAAQDLHVGPVQYHLVLDLDLSLPCGRGNLGLTDCAQGEAFEHELIDLAFSRECGCSSQTGKRLLPF